jgi:hypothetical protein
MVAMVGVVMAPVILQEHLRLQVLQTPVVGVVADLTLHQILLFLAKTVAQVL